MSTDNPGTVVNRAPGIEPAPAIERVRDRLQALAQRQAQQIDPMAWHNAQRLMAQADMASGMLRTHLLKRLNQHLHVLHDRVQNAQDDRPGEMTPAVANPVPAQVQPLSALVAAAMPPRGTPLNSLAPMRDLHARLKVRQQLRQALAQPLRHAGPLHSERLVQQSLAQLQGISGAYLQRFMAYLDALVTFDEANALRKATPGTAGRPQPGAKKVKASSATRR